MFVAEVIGNLGRDAEMRSDNGRKYLQFSVAHSVRFKRTDGQVTESTTWVSCFYANVDGEIMNYLKAGQRVFVRGNAETRLYSSEKDRKLKAGLTINVREIELVGGSSEAVPRELATVDGEVVNVDKYYWTDLTKFGESKPGTLYDRRGNPYAVNPQGWVTAIAATVQEQTQDAQANEDTQTEEQTEQTKEDSKSCKNSKK